MYKWVNTIYISLENKDTLKLKAA